MATCDAIVMNVPALAARLPPGPTHTITGSGEFEQCLDDLARRVERATGRVELDDDGRRALALRLGDPVANVGLHDLVDHAVDGQHVNAIAFLGQRRSSEEKREAESEQNARETGAALDLPLRRFICLCRLSACSQKVEQQSTPRFELVRYLLDLVD